MKDNGKNKPSRNLDLFDNSTNQSRQSTAIPNAGEKTSHQSKVICFSTASDHFRSAASASLKERAMKSILDRANKLKW